MWEFTISRQTVTNAVCWQVTPCRLVEIYRRFRQTFSPCIQTRRVKVLYEGGSCTLLRIVRKFLPVYTASHIRRYHSSKYCTGLCFTYINCFLHKRYQAFRRRHPHSANELGYGGFIPVQTIQAHVGVEVRLHSLIPRHQMKVCGQNSRLSCFTFGARATVSLTMRQSGPHSRSERLGEDTNPLTLQGTAGKLLRVPAQKLYSLYNGPKDKLVPYFATYVIRSIFPQILPVKYDYKLSRWRYSLSPEIFRLPPLPLYIPPYSTNNLVTKLYFIFQSMKELMPMSAWLDYHFNWNHVIL
jgi:hypothetical protein